MGIGRYILYTAAVVALPAFMGCPDGNDKKPNPDSPMYEVQKLERQVAEEVKTSEKGVNDATKDLEKALTDSDQAIEKLLDAYRDLEKVEDELDKESKRLEGDKK